MPGCLQCDHRHRSKARLYEAALVLSRGEALPECKCGEAVRYYMDFQFANEKKEPLDTVQTYKVLRVARLYSRLRPDGYDPFLFLLQHEDNARDKKVWPIFWAPDKKGKIRGGQFPPLLSSQDWKRLFRKLEQ